MPDQELHEVFVAMGTLEAVVSVMKELLRASISLPRLLLPQGQGVYF